jgi:hypothetical protein
MEGVWGEGWGGEVWYQQLGKKLMLDALLPALEEGEKYSPRGGREVWRGARGGGEVR